MYALDIRLSAVCDSPPTPHWGAGGQHHLDALAGRHERRGAGSSSISGAQAANQLANRLHQSEIPQTEGILGSHPLAFVKYATAG